MKDKKGEKEREAMGERKEGDPRITKIDGNNREKDELTINGNEKKKRMKIDKNGKREKERKRRTERGLR